MADATIVTVHRDPASRRLNCNWNVVVKTPGRVTLQSAVTRDEALRYVATTFPDLVLHPITETCLRGEVST